MQNRNIAIIAHVDHGKTTLVDQMLRQAGSAEAETPPAIVRAPSRFDLLIVARSVANSSQESGV